MRHVKIGGLMHRRCFGCEATPSPSIRHPSPSPRSSLVFLSPRQNFRDAALDLVGKRRRGASAASLQHRTSLLQPFAAPVLSRAQPTERPARVAHVRQVRTRSWPGGASGSASRALRLYRRVRHVHRATGASVRAASATAGGAPDGHALTRCARCGATTQSSRAHASGFR